MITVTQADKIIAQHLIRFPIKKCPLEEAYGHVLKEDIYADRDQPPFDRVTMDGIAINLKAWTSGRRWFHILGIQKAGMPDLTLEDGNACLEVMTGAILPKGSNCVIPLEDIQIKHHLAEIHRDLKLTLMQNVHRKGKDYHKGKLLLRAGEVLFSPQISVAAAAGVAKVKVSLIPRIAVVGTGDELVEIDQIPETFQIRNSNAYTIEAALKLKGFHKVSRFILRDDKKKLFASLTRILKNFDVIILSGGVSQGKFDFLPEVLRDLRVRVIFHKVKQKPGKPFWFGMSRNKRVVFALPGNPVSTQICIYRYVLPYLCCALGMKERQREYASLPKRMSLKNDLTHFLPVQLLVKKGGALVAHPVQFSGSGDFASLSRSEGFIELSEHKPSYPVGSLIPLWRFR